MSETIDNFPLVTLTESAVEKLRAMLAQAPEAQGKCLRLSVEKGGCSGWQYGMEFTQPRAGDLNVDASGVLIVVEPNSAGFLRGSEVDYAETLTEVGFKIRNPNARQSCGCGKSFEA